MSLSGGTILFPYARHVILYLVLVQPRKRPDMAEIFFAWPRADPEGDDMGYGSPLKDHKKGFLGNTGPNPLKNRKLLDQNSMLGHHLDASETPFKWRFTGGPMMARF